MASPSQSLERTLPVAILALAVLTVPVLVLAPDGLPRLRAMQRELARIHAEDDALRRDVSRLRVEVRRLREDPSAVERIARDELGLVRKNEIVFQFPKP
ncbi:MAG: septum formation initiator family protein [Myxococcales bacterium]|nr:septum formation initiator family protein [Myxococcales bacterium]